MTAVNTLPLVTANSLSSSNDLLEKSKQAFSARDHYFQISTKFLTKWYDQLFKREARAYLLHARSANPKKEWCSLANYNKARKCLGLPHSAFDAANNGLIDKGLIRERANVKSRCYRVVPKQLISLSDAEEVIFLPSSLIDEGKLKELTLFELKVLLKLYQLCRWEESLGVDFQALYARTIKYPQGIIKSNRVFEGLNPSIEGKTCYVVLKHKTWRISEELIKCLGEGLYKALNQLAMAGLIEYVPVVVWEDPEDEMISRVEYEVMTKFSDVFDVPNRRYSKAYILPPLSEGQRVIWAIRPVYVARNTDYKKYLLRKQTQEEVASNLYSTW